MMTAFELYYKKRPIELILPGSNNPICLNLISFESFNNKVNNNKFHFIKISPINIQDFDYFTGKILDFYIYRELNKHLKLFYINESFFFELII